MPEEKLTQDDIKIVKDFVDTLQTEIVRDDFDFVSFSSAFNRAAYESVNNIFAFDFLGCIILVILLFLPLLVSSYG